MTRPRTTLGVLFIAAVTTTGCGGGSHFADREKPAPPVNVSVYINDQRISVSPPSVTPGTITITIANQSSSAQSLVVSSAGGSTAATTTGPISPQATDQVTVNLAAGQYSVGIAPTNSTQAAAATPTGIMAGSLTVQGQRPSSNTTVLLP